MRKKFGEILIETGVLDQKTLDQALEIQRGTRTRIGQVLEEMRIISEREIAAVLARQFGFRTVRNLSERHFSHELLGLVPHKLALAHQVFPIRLTARELFVAMANPLDMEALDALSFQAGKRITPCVTTPSEINAAIERHYAVEDTMEQEHAPQRTRVLLVEPAETLRRELSAALCTRFEVAEARDAKDALQMCKHLKPKIVLISTLLPQASALELLKRTRRDLARDYLPAIALSASPTIQEEVLCLEGGFSDFLPVPVHPQRLLARVVRSLALQPV